MATEHVTYCVLLAGLPGSGKTWLARYLEEHVGMARLCPDELMFQRHGVYGRDFPRGFYRVRERPVLQEVAVDLHAQLAAGRNSVLDQGLWTPEDRSHWRDIAVEAGATPVLVYLPVSEDVQWERIRARNPYAASDANSIAFSQEDLARFAGRFQAPEEEPHIVYTGQLDNFMAQLPGSLATKVDT